MQIVIDIPDRIFKMVCNNHRMGVIDCDVIHEVIANGTPLPKRHGRLMIISEDKVKENQIDLDFSLQKWIGEVDLSNATVAIIEADKGR